MKDSSQQRPEIDWAITEAASQFDGVAKFTEIPIAGRDGDEARAAVYGAINRVLNAYDGVERAVIAMLAAA